MWATTKAIATIGAIYFVAGVAITVGVGVGMAIANKIEEKMEA